MSKYQAMYKCLLCGELAYLGEPIECTFEEIEDLTARIHSQHIHFGSRLDLLNVKEKLPTKCRNGSIGISLFAGFKKIQ